MARGDGTLHDGGLAVGTAGGDGHGNRGHGGRGQDGNAVPVLAPDIAVTDEDTPLDFRVLANDRDADRDPLRVVAVNPSGTEGVIAIPQGGRAITYDPRGAFDRLPEGATAEDSFGYTASDQRGGLDTSTVTVTVTGVNDAPVARDDAATTDEDRPVTIDVLANDSDIDAGDTLTVVEESGIPGPARSTITPDGRIQYDPGGAFESLAVGERATDSFTYVVQDALGARAEARVTVTVLGINDDPMIQAVTFTLDEQQPAQALGVVPASDPDASDALTYSIVAGNEAGLFAIDPATGELATTGPLNFEARAEHTLTVAVADPHGGTAQADVTVAVGDVAGDVPENVFSLADLDGSNGFVINGVNAGDQSGFSVSAAGDVNGDGIADLIVGAPGAEAGYVVFGGAGVGAAGSIDLAGLDGTNGFVIAGAGAGGSLGWSVSDAGDVNGDGIADLIVGGPGKAGGTGFLGGPEVGGAYVVFGGQDIGATGSLDVAGLDGRNGFVVEHTQAFALARIGSSVSSAGDVNSDGVDDFIIASAAGNPFSQQPEGETYVVFGGSDVGGTGNLDLAGLDGSNGFVTRGAASFNISITNSTVSGAGDVNGDGIDDLITGVPVFRGAGGALVAFGDPDIGASGVLGPLLDGSNGFNIVGTNPVAPAGGSVSGGGDLNNDGFDDLLITGLGPLFTSDPGGTYVVFGGADVGASGRVELSGLGGGEGLRLANVFGPVSFAGDVNGDGIGDFISTGTDEVYVVFGRTDLGASDRLDGSDLDGTDGFIIRGPQEGIGLGASVSNAGDVNGDGIDDLIIGAPQADPDGRADAGQSFVVFGTPGGAPLQLAEVLDGAEPTASPEFEASAPVDGVGSLAAPEVAAATAPLLDGLLVELGDATIGI